MLAVTLRRDRFGPTLLAATFVVVVCLSIAAIEVWRTLAARELVIHDKEIAASNLARSLSQHATDAFLQADAVTLAIVDRLATEGTTPRTIESVHRLLVKQMAALQQFQRLAVIDADGFYLTTDLVGKPSRLSHLEREYFKYHAEHDDHAAHFSSPFIGRSTNQWTVSITRRINKPDGTFGGVVLAAIDLEYFTRYYSRFDIGLHGTIVLMDAAGVVINRRPHNDAFAGRSLAKSKLYRDYASRTTEGTARIVSTIDAVDRIVAYKRLEDFPAYVVVAYSWDETLADWMADTTIHMAGATTLIVILLLLGMRVITQIRSRHRVELALTQSQTQLRALNVTLEDMARRDGLTGLFNRREFDRMIDSHLARIDVDGQPLALFIVDVDSFKVYNDTYGHFLGDECLRLISTTLEASATRPGDLVARYGGEEFVVLLPATDAAGATAAAENFRDAVNALRIPNEGCPSGYVSVSMGVSAVGPNDSHRSAKQLFDQADQALYSAKRRGKNRVERYELRLVA